MAEKEVRKHRAGRVIKAYGKAGSKYPWLFASAVFGLVLIEGAGIIGPIFLSQFINTLTTSAQNTDTAYVLLGILLAMSGASFLGWIGQRIRSVSTRILELRVICDLSNQAFSYLLRHSHDFFISNFAGGLTRRVNRYSSSFEVLVDVLLENVLPLLFFAAGVIFTLSLKNPLLGFGVFVWCVLMLLAQFWLTRMGQPLRLKSSAEDTRSTGILSDAIANHSSVVLFSAVNAESRRYENVNKDWKEASKKAWAFESTIHAAQGLFAIALEFILLGGGIYLWAQGIITVGDFVLIQVLMIGLITRIWGMGNSMRRVYNAISDADEMIQILDTPHAIKDREGAVWPTHAEGELVLKDVSFGYGNRPILTNLNLHIPPGQKVAFVGPSGAGKTTITKLLLRLYDVTAGKITLDGTDIRDIAQDSLRTLVSFVPQDPVLFHRSLRDNIRYGKEGATDEEIIEAAKKAHCHDFISKLPLGYDTLVGERGVKLSGGERQRVAIARAILKNAPVLILDEATSALDSESEHLIQDALKTLMQGKTVIVIAHRLSTIMNMDRIIVMQDGRIVADGTHNELLEQGELYHKLWSIQAGGFIQD